MKLVAVSTQICRLNPQPTFLNPISWRLEYLQVLRFGLVVWSNAAKIPCNCCETDVFVKGMEWLFSVTWRASVFLVSTVILQVPFNGFPSVFLVYFMNPSFQTQPFLYFCQIFPKTFFQTTCLEENEFFARHQRFSLEHSPLQFGFCRHHPSERHESVCLQCKTRLCWMCTLAKVA